MESQTSYVDHIRFSLIFTRSYLPVQNLGDRHPNTIELASYLVHVLCDFKVSVKNTMEVHLAECLYFTFLVKDLHLSISLGDYLYLILFYILLSQN